MKKSELELRIAALELESLANRKKIEEMARRIYQMEPPCRPYGPISTPHVGTPKQRPEYPMIPNGDG